MKSGQLRHRITLQSPSGTRDAVGERSTTWTNVATVWASVEPLSTSERHIAAQAHTFLTHRVTIRYASVVSAIDASWRVLFGDRVLTIEGVRNLNERNITLELVCTEGERQE